MKKTNTILKSLGIHGWHREEPCIIAALATGSSLLLIGAHGTAKSLLLEKLAEALQLRFRHYNASILNFDDLAGFPAPKADKVEYLRTPLDAWDAQAIFIDEISRCRLDMQNRLFPIVHEKKLQGKELAHLKYCWSAMNPPHDDYAGTQPLDIAFADRYHWLIPVPKLLSLDDQLSIIQGSQADGDADLRLQAAIRETRGRLRLVEKSFGPSLAPFIQALTVALERADLPISLRRAHVIYKNTLALLATGRYIDIFDASTRAVLCSIPQSAQRSIPHEVLIQALKASKKLLNIRWDPILKELLIEKDPLKRIQICLRSNNDDIITATILDAHAGLEYAPRLAFSVRLFSYLVENHSQLPGLLFEALGRDVSDLQSLKRSVERIATHSKRYQLADRISKECAKLSSSEGWIEEVLWQGFNQKKLTNIPEVISFARRLQSIFPHRIAS
ncbi:MAG: AAA family ATPase [Myxococcota bacterium]|nr:AAA family ATPase [Myxococcota bacterium]